MTWLGWDHHYAACWQRMMQAVVEGDRKEANRFAHGKTVHNWRADKANLRPGNIGNAIDKSWDEGRANEMLRGMR